MACRGRLASICDPAGEMICKPPLCIHTRFLCVMQINAGPFVRLTMQRVLESSSSHPSISRARDFATNCEIHRRTTISAFVDIVSRAEIIFFLIDCKLIRACHGDMSGVRDNRVTCVDVYRIQIALTSRRHRLDSLFYRYIKVIVSHTVDMPSAVTLKCPHCRAFANSAHVANVNYICRDIMSPSLQLYAQCISYTINIYSIVRYTNGTPEIYRRTIRYMHNLEEGKNAILHSLYKRD